MSPTAEPGEIESQLARRRAALLERWNLNSELVLVGAGDLIAIPGRGDVTYPFRAHSEYLYLTDENEPGGVLALDPGEGWCEFHAPVTTDDRLWLGAQDETAPLTTDHLPAWLAARRGRLIACLGAPVSGVAYDRDLSRQLRLELARLRGPKDSVELARMRVASEAARVGFAAAEEYLCEGTTERRLKIELEAAAFRAEADFLAFDTVVASGPNSAVLHFAPGSRAVRRGEFVLIDAGPEHRGYSSDVTRTYVAEGEATGEQREIYRVVQSAQAAALERCRAGVEWRDAHFAAGVAIAEGLVAIGLLRGRPESLVESGAASLFFPHGIGHLLGLGARDAGWALPEREGNGRWLAALRIDIPLEVGMVVTVEPGIYFVPALLTDRERRSAHQSEIAWDRVDRMLGFGGIRIEDNVLITAAAPEILTREIPTPML